MIQAGYVQSSSPASFSETAESGHSVGSLNFGNFQPVNLGGNVFEDVNGDGTRNSGEPGLSGWTINLINSANTVVATATTDASGNYSFNNVGPGAYTVEEVVQPGYSASTVTSYSLTTESGLNVPGLVFGNYVGVSLEWRGLRRYQRQRRSRRRRTGPCRLDDRSCRAPRTTSSLP